MASKPLSGESLMPAFTSKKNLSLPSTVQLSTKAAKISILLPLTAARLLTTFNDLFD